MRLMSKTNGLALLSVSVLALSLAGCSSEPGSLSPGGSSASDKLANLLAFNTANPGPIAPKPKDVIKIDCPTVEVQDGTAAARYYAGARTNDNVRYQFSVTDVARECAVVDGKIIIKVGVAGRALLGPKGSAGNFSAPLRVAIRQDTAGGKVLLSKVYTASASLGAEANDAPFSIVAENLEVPFLREYADQDYTVLVGFDAGAAKAPSVRHRRKVR